MAFFSRGKNKIQDPYTLPDMYQQYIKDKQPDTIYYVSYKKYVKICSEYYKAISEQILDGKEFKMPFSLGSIYIIKKVKAITLKRPPINWIESIKIHKQVFNFNEHSKGYTYGFYWFKKNSRVMNMFYYKLIMSRAIKRTLAKKLKSGTIDYFEKS